MIHLITEEEIKSLTDVGNNVDVEKFTHFIAIAQQKKIRNAIGTECFNDLLTQAKNNTLTAANNVLLNGNGEEYEGIKPALAWWTLYYSFPSLHSSVLNTGVSTRTGDNFQSVDVKILELRRTQAKDQAEYYLDQVICYIQENETDYPCYGDNDNNCDKPIGSGYQSGIILETSKKCKNKCNG